MHEPTPEERLVVRVALATCFSYPLASGEVPLDDVRMYVRHLIDLHARKPRARIDASGDLPQDLRAALAFCADRLGSSAPEQAAELLAALGDR